MVEEYGKMLRACLLKLLQRESTQHIHQEEVDLVTAIIRVVVEEERVDMVVIQAVGEVEVEVAKVSVILIIQGQIP